MTFYIDQVDSASIGLVKGLFATIFPKKPNAVYLLKQPKYKAWIAYAAKGDAHITPIGFILVQHVLDEAEITDLGVVPSHRRCGVATTMLRRIVSDFRAVEVKKIFLEVDETNKSAIQLYKQIGFVEIARRRDYYCVDYCTSHDALNMYMNINYKNAHLS